MVERHLRQRALAHRGLEAHGPAQAAAGVHLRLEPPCVQIALRAAGRGFARRVAEVFFGLEPPAQAGTVAADGEHRILWLGPDEWLLVTPEDATGSHALLGALEQALDGEHALASDVSHGRVVFALDGTNARAVLMKGCSLDLDPVAFGPGRCAEAPLARAHMLLHQLDDTPRYHVYAHRSFADYVYSWLQDAAAEYGVKS